MQRCWCSRGRLPSCGVCCLDCSRGSGSPSNASKRAIAAKRSCLIYRLACAELAPVARWLRACFCCCAPAVVCCYGCLSTTQLQNC